MEGDMASESKREILEFLTKIQWGRPGQGCPSCGASSLHEAGCGVKLMIWKLEYSVMPGRGSSVRIPEAVRTGARPAFA